MKCDLVVQFLQLAAAKASTPTTAAHMRQCVWHPDPRALVRLLQKLNYEIPEVLLKWYMIDENSHIFCEPVSGLQRLSVELGSVTHLQQLKNGNINLFLRLDCHKCGEQVDCLAFSIADTIDYYCSQCANIVYCPAAHLASAKIAFVAIFFDFITSQTQILSLDGVLRGPRDGKHNYLEGCCEEECATEIDNSFVHHRFRGAEYLIEGESVFESKREFAKVLEKVLYAVSASNLKYEDTDLQVSHLLFECNVSWKLENYGCYFSEGVNQKLGFYIDLYADEYAIIEEQESGLLHLVLLSSTEPLLESLKFKAETQLEKNIFTVQFEKFSYPIVDVAGNTHFGFQVLYLHLLRNRPFLICINRDKIPFVLEMSKFLTPAELSLHNKLYKNFDIRKIASTVPELVLPEFYANRVDELLEYYMPASHLEQIIERTVPSSVNSCSQLVKHLKSNWCQFSVDQRQYYAPYVHQMCYNLGITIQNIPEALAEIEAAIVESESVDLTI